MSFPPSFEHLALPCGLLSEDGRLQEGNAALLSLFGFAGGEVKDAPVLAAEVGKALAEGYCELSLPEGKDSAQSVLSLCPLRSAHSLVLIAALSVDQLASMRRAYVETLAEAMNQSQLAGSALAEVQGQFAALSEQCPVGVYISRNNLVCYANKALAHMFHFRSAQDVLGQISCDDLVSPEERQAVNEQRHIAVQSGSAQYYFLAQRQDGLRFSARVQERAILYEGCPAILGVLSNVSERSQFESEQERCVSSDAVTGLPGRALLFDRLHQMIARARRDDELFALLFLDLDCFNEVNVHSGQEIGNRVLRIAAERFASALRSSDTLVRIGNDQFAVIAESLLFGDDVEPVAQKLCAVLKPPIVVAEQEFHLGVSIGVALFPASGENADALYRAADSVMQTAKKTKRGSYILAGVVK